MNQTDQPATLYCPKCQGAWRRIERNGVIIDQCEQCQGMFFDRGEFEQLMNAERAYYNSPPPTAGYPPQQNQTGQGGFLGSLLGGHNSGRRSGGHH